MNKWRMTAIPDALRVIESPIQEINSQLRDEVVDALLLIGTGVGADIAFSTLDTLVLRGLELPLASVAAYKIMTRTGAYSNGAIALERIFRANPSDSYVSYFFGAALAASGAFEQLSAVALEVWELCETGKVPQMTVSRWATLLLQLGLANEAAPFVGHVEDPRLAGILSRKLDSYRDFTYRSSVPVRVVNLRRDERKRKICHRVLANAGFGKVLPLVAVEASTLPQQTLDSLIGDKTGKPPITAGTAGCWLSHVAAWEAICNHDSEWGIVLEDDAMPEFHSMFVDEVLDKLRGFDFVWLNERMSGKSLSLGSKDVPEPLDPWLLFAHWGSGRTAVGSDAYLMNKRTAETLLELSKASGIGGHLDGFLAAWTLGPRKDPVNRIQHLLCDFQERFGSSRNLRSAALSIPLFKEENFGFSSR